MGFISAVFIFSGVKIQRNRSKPPIQPNINLRQYFPLYSMRLTDDLLLKYPHFPSQVVGGRLGVRRIRSAEYCSAPPACPFLTPLRQSRGITSVPLRHSTGFKMQRNPTLYRILRYLRTLHIVWSLVRRRVTRRLTRLQTMYNVLKFTKHDEIMSNYKSANFVNLIRTCSVRAFHIQQCSVQLD